MKKIILSMALAIAILGSAFATPANYEPSVIVKEAFAKEFCGVKEVQWDKMCGESVYEAKFTFNNETLQAYFSVEGEFLGTMRLISAARLPVLAANELAKEYPNAHIVSIYEHSMPDALAYYITVTTEKGGLVLKATGSGDLTVYKRYRG